VRGQCSTEASNTVVVHPDPQPAVQPVVHCGVEKYFTLHPVNIPAAYRSLTLEGWHCRDSTALPPFDGTAITTPLEVDSCYRFHVAVEDQYGCSGSGALEFIPPPDPLAVLSVARTRPITEMVFAVQDSSLHVAQRSYVADSAEVTMDSLHQVVTRLTYRVPGDHAFKLYVEGEAYTCPDSAKVTVHATESLWVRWGPKHPRPVAYEPTKFHDARGCSQGPRKTQPCPACRRSEDEP